MTTCQTHWVGRAKPIGLPNAKPNALLNLNPNLWVPSWLPLTNRRESEKLTSVWFPSTNRLKLSNARLETAEFENGNKQSREISGFGR